MIRRLNIPLLVISLLLALTLWIVVQAQTMQFESKDIVVPLRYEYLDPRFVIVKIQPTVPVTIEGPSDKLDSAAAKNAQAIVNLRDATAGVHTYDAIVSFADRDVNRLLPQNTARVTIEIEEKQTRTYRVDVQTKGYIADHTVIYGGAQCDPAYVEFSGSKAALDSIVKVRALLNLEEVNPAQPDKKIQCDVDALDGASHSIPFVTPSVSKVSVRPTINPASVIKDLFIIPSVSGRPAQGYEVTGYEAIPQRLRVTGQSMKLASSSSVWTFPIDVSGLRQTVTLPAQLDLQKGLTRVEKRPIQVRIFIVREQLPEPTSPTQTTPKKQDPAFPDHVPPLTPPKGGGH